MGFEALVADLESLQKSQALGDSGDDQRIADAAADGDDSVGAGDAGDVENLDAVDLDDEPDEDEDETFGKSFAMTLEDGTVIEAVDGSAMVKALMEKNEALTAQITEQEGEMSKALTTVVETIKGQSELIKSLQEQVSRLSGEGRGRKAVVSVAEKPAATLTKSEPTGMSGSEFMAKCEAAFSAGQITGRDVSIAETALQNGIAVPEHIVSKVLA